MYDTAAVGGWQWRIPVGARRLAVLALALGERDLVAAIRRSADDLEPAVLVAEVEERPVGPPARPTIVALRSRDDPALAAGSVDQRDLPGGQVIGRLLAGHGELRPVRRPVEPVHVEPAFGERRRHWGLGLALRPSTARDRSIDEPDLAPAATAGDERQAAAVRRPARLATTTRLGDHASESRTVRLDDPDLVVTHEGQAPAVG